MKLENKVYRAALYVRLSKEAGDKEESDSIINQRALIRNFLRDKSDIQVCGEFTDDGYTGANFDRPGFKKLLREVEEGNIDCIIVKDLSRFGRNFVEAGRYIDQIFPSLGVRFIAVNDDFDSIRGRTSTDRILVPFKNLINDAFCRDISIKVRSQLEIKRYDRLKISLYEALNDGLISKTEYLEMKAVYNAKIQEARAAESKLKAEMDDMLNNAASNSFWIERFKEHQNITELTRRIAVTLIERIIVFEDCRLNIRFRYQYDYDRAVALIQNVQRLQAHAAEKAVM